MGGAHPVSFPLGDPHVIFQLFDDRPGVWLDLLLPCVCVFANPLNSSALPGSSDPCAGSYYSHGAGV